MLRNANLKYATRGRVNRRTKGQADSMKVLEKGYVAARARRVHHDLPHSQVMKCVTCRLEEKNRFIPELVKKVRSGVSARRRSPRHWRSDEESERDSVCLEGYAETGTSSKMFCSRSVSDRDGGQDKDFAQVSVPSAPT